MAGAVRDIAAVRRAKAALLDTFQGQPWFRGAGIAPTDDGFALRLNVDPSAAPEVETIPSEFMGIPVEIVYIAGYSAR